MANEFKIKKGLIVTGASGGTVVDIQGSQGQLFSVTDDLSGSIFAVSDISGVPIMNVNSDGTSYFDGNVGIGTTSPSNLLHIHASGNNASALIIEDDVRRLQLGRDMIEARTADGSSVETLYIQPNGNTSFGATTGNVGVGTTSPGYKLDVNGVINVSDNNPIRSGNEIMIRRTDSTNLLRIGSGDASDETQFYAGGAERVRIDSSGNVGIGTTDPGAKLHIVGTDVNQLFIERTGSITGKYRFGIAGSNNRFYIKDEAQGQDRIVIYQNGNVGIGTNSPGDPLTVVGKISSLGGTNNAKNVKIYANDSFGYLTTNASKIYMSTQLQVDSGLIGSYNEDLQLQVSGSTKMYINSSGNVGIGTTSPADKLHIYNNGDVAIRLQNQADTSGNTWRLWQDNWNGTSNFTFNIDYGSTNVLTATTSGNVGIGTTDPQSKLQVDGGVQMADDTDAASADKVGTLRYRTSGNNSYVDMCMQTGATTYEWVNIVQNNW